MTAGGKKKYFYPYVYDAARDRNRTLVRKYGITSAQFDVMERRQNGLCAVCGTKPKRRLHVDHDHVTMRVRGLLCIKCNFFMGLLEARMHLMSRFFRYLGLSFHGVEVSATQVQRPR